MFGNEETLIVVYKDEMVLNQFKKLAESRNRDQEYLANHPELNIIAWNEKTWLNNKKAGNIRGKILYLGQLKGTKELIPVVDIKFQKYGVCFGWAGNQAVLYGNRKNFKTKEEYLEEKVGLPDWWKEDMARKDVLFFSCNFDKSNILDFIDKSTFHNEVVYVGKHAVFWGKYDESEYLKTTYHKKLIKQDFYKKITIRNSNTFEKIAKILEEK